MNILKVGQIKLCGYILIGGNKKKKSYLCIQWRPRGVTVIISVVSLDAIFMKIILLYLVSTWGIQIIPEPVTQLAHPHAYIYTYKPLPHKSQS